MVVSKYGARQLNKSAKLLIDAFFKSATAAACLRGRAALERGQEGYKSLMPLGESAEASLLFDLHSRRKDTVWRRLTSGRARAERCLSAERTADDR